MTVVKKSVSDFLVIRGNRTHIFKEKGTACYYGDYFQQRKIYILLFDTYDYKKECQK